MSLRTSSRKKRRSRRTSKSKVKKQTSRKPSRTTKGKKPSRKRSRKVDVQTLCKRRLQKKIEMNIKEYEQGKFISRQQALAVAYSQVNSKYPECRQFYKR